tara:strand:- start:231 stop:464 length:234 start_codon:yes stop_codon:yes gene_type:complete
VATVVTGAEAPFIPVLVVGQAVVGPCKRLVVAKPKQAKVEFLDHLVTETLAEQDQVALEIQLAAAEEAVLAAQGVPE